MLVFRLENDKGIGPVHCSEDEIPYIWGMCKGHKSPQQMNMDHLITPEHFFSWSTIELFRNFIRMDKKKLAHKFDNWHISVYETNNKEDVIMPDGQVAFVRKNARKVDEIKLRNLNMVKKYNKK